METGAREQTIFRLHEGKRGQKQGIKLEQEAET